MDHANSHTNAYYYPPPLYATDVYLPDASTSATHASDHAYVYQEEEEQQQQQEPQYSYSRYQRHLNMQQQQQQHHHHHNNQHNHPRHHSHSQSPPAPQQSFHQPQLHPQHHDHIRHPYPPQTLPCPSPPILTAERVGSPPRVKRSPPSEASTSYLSNNSDPLSALRNDLQVHAAATALTQAAGQASDHYQSSGVLRLPPIMQVEKQQVTTTATQAASASRRRNEATFRCPVPGCGSTFTRRFNLKGHLRSHTSERPYVCEWPGCGKGFARQHDCKRHYQLHSAKAGTHMCHGCGKSFSRTDALNRHLRSEGGLECRMQQQTQIAEGSALLSGSPHDSESLSDSTTDGSRSRPGSV